MTIPNDPFGTIKDNNKDAGVPAAKTVNLQHTKSDVDSGQFAQHHTLGIKRNQASPGRHNHDGSDSVLIGNGKTLTISGKLSPTTVADMDVIVDSLISALSKVVKFDDQRI